MKRMSGSEIREAYLRFFESKGHKRLPSASLIPANDPSILWTAAGMVPFKPYFTGAAKPEVRRITTCQKSLRTPDIESVGRTARHHTFFEMLGNFSFGDYFKKEAIPWAWEFVTKCLEMPVESLWITIYLDDDEAFEIWNKDVGVSADRIVRLDKDTNFWEIGVGPCGPCSEIYVDLGADKGCDSPDCAVGCDCDRYLEIWNLVFIQFFRDEAGNYTPLESKGIDTGMGLERVASVLQNVPSNFDTDIFREIMDFAANEIGVQYGTDQKTDLALKVIADHCRAVTFAVADGAFPSNEGRGYVLRRLIRRAVRFGRLLGETKPFLYKVSSAIIAQMSSVYPELEKYKDNVLKVLRTEEERFGETLSQGTEILNKLVQEAEKAGQKVISGLDAFKLYDTYGFPLELTKEMAEENGLGVDEDGFTQAMEEQRQRARNARQETEYISEMGSQYKDFRDSHGETEFVGYTTLEAESRVLALYKEGQRADRAVAGEEIQLILDSTPCYAEAGGQVADYALVTGAEVSIDIREVFKPVEGLIVHKGRISQGMVRENDVIKVAVDQKRRKAVARNHSATHLLHKSLKSILGEHVNQAGSSVDPDRLRFDFTHLSPVSKDEMLQIESIVNQNILASLPVTTSICSLQEAQTAGATALFGEKYGEQVRMVQMGDFSTELCAGTHVSNTAEVGLCKILGESSIGSGLRRIEAVTGEGALHYIHDKDQQLEAMAEAVKTSAHEVVHRVESLVKEHKELEREAEALRAKLAHFEVQSMLESVTELKGVPFLAAKVSNRDMDSLRAMLDLLRERMESGVVVLATAGGDKVHLVTSVSKDLQSKGLHAGKIIKEVAAVVDGNGGGRPDMAQAGGKNVQRIQEALDKAKSVVLGQL